MWKTTLDRILQSYTHPGWGYMHSLRLIWLTQRIVREEMLQIDLDILYAAAYIHDLGAFPPYRQPKLDHTVRSVEICPEILEKVHGPSHKIHQIQEVIQYHMFSTNLSNIIEKNFPTEVWVFRDADILEFLGFVGISRLFALVGLDDWVPTKESAIALIHKFQHDLPHLLHFNSAQEIGQVRVHEIDRYFATEI